MIDTENEVIHNTYMEQQIPQPGQRVECVEMVDDPNPVPAGTQGTVTHVDHWGILERGANIHVAWDNGRTLALLSDLDKWKVL